MPFPQTHQTTQQLLPLLPAGNYLATQNRFPISSPIQTPEDGRRSVEWALERGFTGVKIKCRAEEPLAARLAAMLDVAGPDFKVTVDPNERFYTAE